MTTVLMRTLLFTLVCIIMSACQSDTPTDTEAKPASPDASATQKVSPRLRDKQSDANPSETERATDIRVVALHLGAAMNAAQDIAEVQTIFSPSDTVYAVVETEGYTASSRLEVRWSHESQADIARSSAVIASDGVARTHFNLHMPEGLPVGAYQIDVSLDGEVAMAQSWQVQQPE